MNKKPFKFGYGDEVFYMGTGKIEKGYVKSVLYQNNKFNNKLEYRLVNKLDTDWGGDLREEHEIFITKAELIQYLENLDI